MPKGNDPEVASAVAYEAYLALHKRFTRDEEIAKVAALKVDGNPGPRAS